MEKRRYNRGKPFLDHKRWSTEKLGKSAYDFPIRGFYRWPARNAEKKQRSTEAACRVSLFLLQRDFLSSRRLKFADLKLCRGKGELLRQQCFLEAEEANRGKMGEAEKETPRGRRTRRRKEKSIQRGRVDSASGRRISQQLPLIPSTNTRNLNARGPAGASIHGRTEEDEGKVRPRSKGTHVIPTKSWLLRSPDFFPTPPVIPAYLAR